MMNPVPTLRFDRAVGQRWGEMGMKAKILASLIACSLISGMMAPLFAQEVNPNVDEITVPEGTEFKLQLHTTLNSSTSSTATGSINEHKIRSPALDVLELRVVCNWSLNSVPSGTVISSTLGFTSCAKRGAIMPLMSEQAISDARIFAFIPISPQR